MTKGVEDLIQSMLRGDKRALARLMTFVDNRHPDLMTIMAAVYARSGRAIKIGITGPPGAGKSTLVDKLIRHFRSHDKTVGVVAIDPSSPFSGGAVLGDRIRMQDHGADDGVFIRSLGSRGSHGGLSRATREVVGLMDAFGFDVIMIETVGVGQTELDIMVVAHVTIVILVPESGDTIQTMKAGLMEIADIFVVNKADREGADRIAAELKSLSHMYRDQKEIPVVKTEAIHNKGIDELMGVLDVRITETGTPGQKGALCQEALSQEALCKEEVFDILVGGLHDQVMKEFREGGRFSHEYQLIRGSTGNPYEAAQKILGRLRWQ